MILEEVSGFAAPGEILAMMGPSGSGKTSLLNCLSGRNPYNSGVVSVNGRPLKNKNKGTSSSSSPGSDMKRLMAKIAYVKQADIFFEHLTVRDQLGYTAVLRLPQQWTHTQKMDEVERILRLLRLTKVADSKIQTLSGGEKKRVNIGTELLTDPAVLLLDEPTSGLDSTSAVALIRMLQNLCRTSNKTIITSIHQPSSALFASFDRLIMLAEGHVVYFGRPRESLVYLNQQGFDCPVGYNGADHWMDLLVQDSAIDNHDDDDDYDDDYDVIDSGCGDIENPCIRQLNDANANANANDDTVVVPNNNNIAGDAAITTITTTAAASARVVAEGGTNISSSTRTSATMIDEDKSHVMIEKDAAQHSDAGNDNIDRKRRSGGSCGVVVGRTTKRECNNRNRDHRVRDYSTTTTTTTQQRLIYAWDKEAIAEEMDAYVEQNPENTNTHGNKRMSFLSSSYYDRKSLASASTSMRKSSDTIFNKNKNKNKNKNNNNTDSNNGITNEKEPSKYNTSWGLQYRTLVHRSMKNSRSAIFTPINLIKSCALGLLSGLLWFQMDYTEARIFDLSSYFFFTMTFWVFDAMFQSFMCFPTERAVILKERSSGSYRLSAYFMGKTTSEMPARLVLPLIYMIISFWMAGISNQFSMFVATTCISLLSVMAGEAIGLLVGATIYDMETGMTVMTVVSLFLALVGGFFVEKVPSFLVWSKYLSPFKYSFDASLQLVFKEPVPCDGSGALTELCGDGNDTGYAQPDQVIKFLGVQGSVGFNVGILLAIGLVPRYIAYVALRAKKEGDR